MKATHTINKETKRIARKVAVFAAAVLGCVLLAPFVRDWFDPVDSLWNPTFDCFPADEQCDRGRMFESRGHFKSRNCRKAFLWYRAAALQGYAEAQYRLANYYENRLGNLAEAGNWYRKAAEGGNEEARKWVERTERQRRDAEERARLEAERKKREADERAAKEAEERARAEAERKQLEAQKRARAEAERKQREAEEHARLEAERKQREAEERVRQAVGAKEEAKRLRREAVFAKGAGRTAGERMEAFVGPLGMAFRWCPATTSDEWKGISGGKEYFRMGSDGGEKCRDADEGPATVSLTHGFWMGETEVTQGLWKEVMDGETVIDLARKALQDDAEYYLGGKKQTMREWWGASRDTNPADRCADLDDDLPVYFVSWDDASRFCEKLESRLRTLGDLPEGYGIRLPTEAEWEYACRAGTKTALPNGSEIEILGENNAPALDDIAWYGGNSSEGFSGQGWDTGEWKEKQYPGGLAGPRKVGTKAVNNWGLYDMIGNVGEWCSDWYDANYGTIATNPAGPPKGSSRVHRGGSWRSTAKTCRPAYRACDAAGVRFNILGLRVVLAPLRGYEAPEGIETIRGDGVSAGERKAVRVGSRDVAFRWCPATTSDEWKGISGGRDNFVLGRDLFSGEDAGTNVETIAKGFWIGETEVTQWLFKEVLGETVTDLARRDLQDDAEYPFGGKRQTLRERWGFQKDADPAALCGDIGDDLPVYHIRYDDALRFCEKLTEMLRPSGAIPAGYEFRLPKEEEWEYAFRAGSTNEIPGVGALVVLGENNAPSLDGIAWYGGNSSVGFEGRGWDTGEWKEKQYPGGLAGPREVALKAANSWGIHDMVGNVSEWCLGGLQFSPPEEWESAWGAGTRTLRMSRGGSWASSAEECRWWLLEFSELGTGSKHGFRVVLAETDATTPQQGQDHDGVGEEAKGRRGEETEAPGANHAAEPGASGSEAPGAGAPRTINVGSQSIRLRYCPADTFTIGSPTDEQGRDNDELQHLVTLSQGFWMGETEVTQGLWKEVMWDNPSQNKSGDDYPVENVSWDDCQRFLDALNGKAPVAGFKWRLPTEAEWEYACRAGTTGEYGGTGLLKNMGWHSENSGSHTHPVGQMRANGWGLHDMHGNVSEWCSDHYWDNLHSSGRVRRGGSCFNGASICRSARRDTFAQGGRSAFLGFRVVLAQDQ